MTNRSFFLDRLGTDDIARAEFVETLRAAAAILGLSSPFETETDVRTGLQLAPRLRSAAQFLCDHCRLCSDGTCRYCDLLMAEAG